MAMTMITFFSIVCLSSFLFHLTHAVPIVDAAAKALEARAHTRDQGTFIGNRLVRSQVDEFLGIPFAEPPLGKLRFAKTKAVKPYRGHTHRRYANKPTAICYQPPSTDSSPAQEQSEDCLHLNVYRPSHLRAGQKVPVMLWLYGGSWQEGSIYEPRVNATNLIKRSVALGEPIVWVAANYRVGAFGFLAGQAIVDAEKRGEAVLNAGLWDQREALNWIQRNIEAFGGDPHRVTLFGESAGAVSVGQHLTAGNGSGSKGLFRAAILESGNAATGGLRPATIAERETTFGYVAKGAGCDQAGDVKQQFTCLQNASVDRVVAGNTMALNNSYIAYLPTLDNFFSTQKASAQWSKGEFLRVPFITGTNLDEGTEFPASYSVTNDTQFQEAQLIALVSTDAEPIFPQILETWSADPAKGEPHRPEYYGVSADDTFYPPEGTNQYKRQASMLHDIYFESGRRLQLYAARQWDVQAWDYRFAQPSPVGVTFDPRDAPPAKAALGIQHEAEIPFVYANPPLQGANASSVPEPLRTYASDANLLQVSNAMSAAWIHFANRLDPNGKDVPVRWRTYASDQDAIGNGVELYIQANNFTVKFDDLEAEQVQFVIKNKEYFAL